MRGPFGGLAPETRRRLIWLSGAVSLVLFLFLAYTDTRISDDGGPGIIPFELAGTTDRAEDILGEWSDVGEDAARVSLVVDYPYLIAYGIFLAAACAAISDRLRRRGKESPAAAGGFAGWLALAGAAFDAIENAALLAVLDGRTASHPRIAMLAAIAKFACTGLAIAYVLVGLLSRR